jgi:hypothetical protein
MSDPIEPLPPDIAALLERERDAYPEDPALKSAVLGRVERAITLAAPPVGAPPKPDVHAAVEAAKRALMTKLLAVGVSAFVAGGVVGGAVVKSLAPPAPSMRAPEPTVLSVVATTPPVPSTSVALVPPATPSATVSASAAPSAVPAPTALATSTAVEGDLTKEREILDAARAALGQGRPDDAIAAAKQHEAKWPRGYLVEEREVVYIQALVAAGRRDEATRRGAAFRRTFPKSMLMPAVDAALGTP